MKHLVNGQEAEIMTSGTAEVTHMKDRLMVRTPEGTRSALVVKSGDKTYISYKGRSYTVEKARRSRSGQSGGAATEVRAPMPGQIVEVLTSVGDEVEVGDRLLILEAMKMQQPMVAGVAGTVAQLPVSVGDQVDEDQLLAEVKPAE